MQVDICPPKNAPTDRSLSILVSGGHLFSRIGLVSLLDQEDGFTVVGHGSHSADLKQLITERQPDLVVLNGDADPMPALRAVVTSAPAPRVLVVVSSRKHATWKGAHLRVPGIRVSLATTATLLPTVRLLRSGYQVAAAHPEHREQGSLDRQRQPPVWERFDKLTEREVEVVHLMLRGWSNGEIADALMLSGATVKSHVHSLMNKLELRSRIDIITTAYTTGLVRPGVPKPNWHPRLTASTA
ncbi:response regulator transcription factor [Streptomyces sp. NPDC002920]